MSGPRNNLDDVRAKFQAESMVAPAVTKLQTAKAFKFKASSSSAQPVAVVIPHAANTPPQRSVPPAATPSHLHARSYETKAVEKHVTPKRPSLDSSDNSSSKRARRDEVDQTMATSTLPPGQTRAKARDAVIISDDGTGSKENLPVFGHSARKPRPPVATSSGGSLAAPSSVSASSPIASRPDSSAKSLDQLRTLLATNLLSELDCVKKLILLKQGLAVDQDAFVLEQFTNVLSARNCDLKASIEQMEFGRPPLQANADLSQMPLDQLRILLVQNLTQELQYAKSMLDPQDQDPVILQMFIDTLNKRNADTKAAIVSRERNQPPGSPNSVSPIAGSRTPSAAAAAYIPPAVMLPARRATPPPAKPVPTPICIDDDDDFMDFDMHTPSVAAAPLQPIQNTVAETTTRVRVRAPAPPAPDPDIDAKKSPHAAEALQVLKKTFGLQGFRKHQLAAITATLSGKDVFVLMPTGGGKSLCYQVPAVCQKGTTRGVTIVVSPLIALMNDQVAHLHAKNVYAVAFNSNNTAESAREERDRLVYQPGKDLPALAYVTPEKLDKNVAFSNLLKKLHHVGRIARFVIDEVHCLATWGRDFRDSYKTLSRLRTDFPGVPIMALTATAHKNNVDDIIAQLNINDCIRLTQSFNRPNLRYAVKRKPAKAGQKLLDEIYAVIRQHDGETGIIYCLARHTCEEVAKRLREGYNVKAKHYHAKMSPDDKAKTQEAWQNGSCKVIVATIAFGMGIDKANVRFVIHHTMPKSLEGYYQETGRAGRDGNESECVLFYAHADFQVLRKQIWDDRENKLSIEDKRRQEEDLRVVVRFCMNDTDCRRSQVLTFFDETFDPSDCHGFCDNCKDSAVHAHEIRDFTPQAQDALRLVQEMMQKNSQITQAQCVAAFSGSKAKEVKDKGFDVLEHSGKGSTLKKGVVERLFETLLVEGVLYLESQRNNSGWSNSYLKLGPQRTLNDFFAGKMRLPMSVKSGTTINVDATEQRSGRGRRQRSNAKPVNRKRRQHNPYDSDAELDQDSGERNDASIAIEDDDPIVVDDDNDNDNDGDEYPFDYDDIRALDDSEETLVDQRMTASTSGAAGRADDSADVVLRALKQRRQEMSTRENVPESSIADDHLLWLLAISMPTDMSTFMALAADHYNCDEETARAVYKRCEELLSICVIHSMQSPSKPPSRANSTLMSAPAPKSTGLNAEMLSKFRFKKP